MRIDLHTHTLLSDGELLPIELARRAVVMGHKALAITDHVVAIQPRPGHHRGQAGRRRWPAEWGLEVLVGVEITHVPARRMDMVVKEARRNGAEIIVIHGETISEPVEKGTNRAAVINPEVDILAHPGFITMEEAELAKRNDVILEITSRRIAQPPTGTWPRWPRRSGPRWWSTPTPTPRRTSSTARRRSWSREPPD